MASANAPPAVHVDAYTILDNLLQELDSPGVDLASLKSLVRFDGGHPFLPLPHKSQAVSAALQGALAIAASRFLQLRGGTVPAQVSIDTDQASLFFASIVLGKLDGHALTDPGFLKLLPPNHQRLGPNDGLAQEIMNLHKTKDGRYFHHHSSLNPGAALKVLGIDLPDDSAVPAGEARKLIAQETLKYTAEELKQKCIAAGIVGDTALTPAEFDATELGKVLNALPVARFLPANETRLPTPVYPPLSSASAKPLEGVRVVEITRIIAGSVGGKLLTELGAQVVRVIGPTLPDAHVLQVDYNTDKRPVHIDLKTEKGVKQLDHLLESADIFLQGYRPGALEKRGVTHEKLAKIAESRQIPYVILDESCYGGLQEKVPSSDRPGFQQIADVVSGVAYETGEAYGLVDENGEIEPVVPCMPISDYCTGILLAVQGVIGLIKNLSTKDGAQTIFSPISLIGIDLFIRRQGKYPSDWVRERYEALGPPEVRFRHDSGFIPMLVTTLKSKFAQDPAYNRPEFYHTLEARGFCGKDVESGRSKEVQAHRGTYVALKPIIRFEGIDTSYKTTAPWGFYRPGWDEDDADRLERHLA